MGNLTIVSHAIQITLLLAIFLKLISTEDTADEARREAIEARDQASYTQEECSNLNNKL